MSHPDEEVTTSVVKNSDPAKIRSQLEFHSARLLHSYQKAYEIYQRLHQKHYSPLKFLNSPMHVQQIFDLLTTLHDDLREYLTNVALTIHEENIHLILNCFKLVYYFGDLLMVSHNDYTQIQVYYQFCLLCYHKMIALSTIRHLKLRLKFYFSSISMYLLAGNTQPSDSDISIASSSDVVYNLHETLLKELLELRHYEEMNASSIPFTHLEMLWLSLEDWYINKCVIHFWYNREVPSSSGSASGSPFQLTSSFFNTCFDNLYEMNGKVFQQLSAYGDSAGMSTLTTDYTKEMILTRLRNGIVCECIRVHTLGSKNRNEVYQERSVRLQKAVMTFLRDILASMTEGEKQVNDQDGGDSQRNGIEIVRKTVNTQTVFECVNFLLSEADLLPTTEFPLDGLPEVITDLLMIYSMEKLSSIGDHEDSFLSEDEKSLWYRIESICLLYKLSYLGTEEDLEIKKQSQFRFLFLKTISKTNQNLEKVLTKALNHSDAYRHASSFQTIGRIFFTKVLYSGIQECLSWKESNTEKDEIQESMISQMIPLFIRSLNVILKVWHLTGDQDGILYGSTSLLLGRLQLHDEDFRGAISQLRKSVNYIDDIRSERTDVSLHLPSDARDLRALQRMSFTLQPGAADWYHSVKRLGAHAFAGFGIFGHGSSAARSDQALAEIHTDLLALYFRVELTYSFRSYHKRILDKRRAAANELKEETLRNDPSLRPDSTVLANLTATLAAKEEKNDRLQNEIDVERLPAVHYLRIFCSQNYYEQTLLWLEMARLDGSPQRQLRYLREAKRTIEEAEESEATICNGFEELTVLYESKQKHPLVLSRCHRYIYVVPVASRVGLRLTSPADTLKTKKNSEPAAYMRVLAKEVGSGTDVSIYNTDLPGCDTRITVTELQSQSPAQSAVRIGPLRRGQSYVFGAAAFTANDELVGTVTPTSPAVGAVNPLPTIILWSLLSSIALELEILDIAHEASDVVCRRFFVHTETQTPISLSSSHTLFVLEEPAMSTLALQQATPTILHHFISSFLRNEALLYTRESFGSARNFSDRRSTQKRYLESLIRCGAVATIAASLGSQELTGRVAACAHQLVAELLAFDATGLSVFVIRPLLSVVLAQQAIPRYQWHDTEHQLYATLTAWLVQAAVLTRDAAPVLHILQSLYSSSENDPKKSLLPIPSEVIQPLLTSLWRYVEFSLGTTAAQALLNDLRLLLDNSPDSSVVSPRGDDLLNFWKLPSSVRTLRLASRVNELSSGSSPEAIFVDRVLTQTQAPKFSDYLVAVAQLVSEASASSIYGAEQPNATTATSASAGESVSNASTKTQGKVLEVVMGLLRRYPLCEDYLSNEALNIVRRWRLPFLIPIEFATAKSAASAPAEAAKGRKAPPPKKGAPASADSPAVDFSIVPASYTQADAEETVAQLSALAEIISCICRLLPRHVGVSSLFVATAKSPYDDLILDFCDRGSGIISPESLSTASIEKPSGIVALQLYGAAIDCFSRARQPFAAANVAVSFWNWVVREYIDAETFAKCINVVADPEHTSESIALYALQALVFTIESARVHWGSLETKEGIMLAGNTLKATASAMADDSLTRALVTGVDKMPSIGDGRLIADDASPSRIRETREMLSTLSGCVAFLSRVVWLSATADEALVGLTSRLLSTYFFNIPGPIAWELSEALLPLARHSQTALIAAAEVAEAAAAAKVDACVAAWEEEQQRKRRKKLRVARQEKDADELAFDAERDSLNAIRFDCADEVKRRKEQYTSLERQASISLARPVTNGRSLYDRSQRELSQFISYLNSRFGPTQDWRQLIVETATSSEQAEVISDVTERLSVVCRHLQSTSRVLRERKERILLVETLFSLGGLLLRFGEISDAEKCLNDAVDGFFNALDTTIDWSTALPAVLSMIYSIPPLQSDGSDAGLPSSPLVTAVPTVLASLGWLARFTAANDMDRRERYTRLARDLLPCLFEESLHHPTRRLAFATYSITSLHGIEAFPRSVLRPLFEACVEFSVVSIATDNSIGALQFVTLAEYLAEHLMVSAPLWLEARLLRCQALTAARLFAEAASMFADMLTVLPRLLTADLSRAQETASLHARYADAIARIQEWETSSVGLCFAGRPVFENSTVSQPPPPVNPTPTAKKGAPVVEPPPSSAGNASAIKWMAEAAPALREFLASVCVRVPLEELSEAERASIESRRVEAAAVDPKGKKAKGAPVPVEPDGDLPSLPFFPSILGAFAQAIISDWLISLGLSSAPVTLPSGGEALQEALRLGRESLTTAYSALYSLSTSPSVAQSLALRHTFPEEHSPSIPTKDTSVLSLADVLRKDGHAFRLMDYLFAQNSSLSLFDRRLREVRGMAEQSLTLLLHPAISSVSMEDSTQSTTDITLGEEDFKSNWNAELSSSSRYAAAHLWLRSKFVQITAQIRQHSSTEVFVALEEALDECDAAQSTFWRRRFVYLRGMVRFQNGDFHGAKVDAQRVIAAAEALRIEDSLLVESLLLRTSSLLEMSRSGLSGKSLCDALLSARFAAGEARRVAFKLARISGLLPMDSVSTFSVPWNSVAILGNALYTPLEYSATTAISNDLPLEVTSKQSRSKFVFPLTEPTSSHKATEPTSRFSLGRDLDEATGRLLAGGKVRNGPVDTDAPVVPELPPLINVYLRESRLLLSTQVALLSVLSQLEECDIWTLIDAAFDDDYLYSLRDAGEADLLSQSTLQVQLRCVAENSLKLSRQCAFIPPVITSQMLYFVTKARSLFAAIPAPWPRPVGIAPGKGHELPDRECAPQPQDGLAVIHSSLNNLVSNDAHYLLDIIRQLSLHAVDLCASPKLDLPVDDDTCLGKTHSVLALNLAAQYLLLAASAGRLQFALLHGCLPLPVSTTHLPGQTVRDLSRDSIFLLPTDGLPIGLVELLSVSFQSSLAPRLNTAVAGAEDTKLPPSPKKSKEPVKNKKDTNVVSPSTYTLRDALLLLSGLSKLRQGVFLDTAENALLSDLHKQLLQHSSPYKEAFSFAATLPVVGANAEVTTGSITSVWQCVPTPTDWREAEKETIDVRALLRKERPRRVVHGELGVYSHAAVYVLLGDPVQAPPPAPVDTKAKPAKGAPVDAVPAYSSSPVLTRVVLPRHHVRRLEKYLRLIRARLMNLTDLAVRNAQRSAPVTGKKPNPKETTTAAPVASDLLSADPRYIALSYDYATALLSVIQLLRQGRIFEATWNLKWSEQTCELLPNDRIRVTTETTSFVMSMTASALDAWVRFFNVQQDSLCVPEPSVCIFLRFALGHQGPPRDTN